MSAENKNAAVAACPFPIMVTGARIIENKYQRSVRRQIGRCVARKIPAANFDSLALWWELFAECGNAGARAREVNRCRLVAAGLREAGL